MSKLWKAGDNYIRVNINDEHWKRNGDKADNGWH